MTLLNSADAIFYGAVPVSAFYRGAEKVWPAFMPGDLFTRGEQGAWYDPSDFSTLFQNDTGTLLPVTTVGQTVALMLDKAGGRGPELLTNHDFASGSDGWDVCSGSPTFEVGSVSLPASSGFGQGIDTTPGAIYEVVVEFAERSGTVRVRIGDTSCRWNQSNLSLPANGRFFFAATTPVTYFTPSTFSNSSATITSVSVREVIGNHMRPAVPEAPPILGQNAAGKYYLEFPTVDHSMITEPFMRVKAGITMVLGWEAVTPGNTATSGLFFLGRGTSFFSIQARRQVGVTQLSTGLRIAQVGFGYYLTPVSNSSFDFGVPFAAIGDVTETAIRIEGANNIDALREVPLGDIQSTSLFPLVIKNPRDVVDRFYGGILLDRLLTPSERAYSMAYMNRQIGAL